MLWSRPFEDKEQRRDALKAEIKSLKGDRDELRKKNGDLDLKLKDLEAQRKREDEEIKHLVKMKEESLTIEFEKKVIAKERETQQKIADVKDEYRDKLEASLNDRLKSMQEMYAQILERLPNVTARFEDKKVERNGNID